jgi:hypothetical protein
MDWRCGSRGRVPALQARRPEFKLHSQEKKKKGDFYGLDVNVPQNLMCQKLVPSRWHYIYSLRFWNSKV